MRPATRQRSLLDQLDGARIIRSQANLHFLLGVNEAARHARGANLLLLNNDAMLLPGSVEAGLRTLLSDATIGAVGGRIILPDGTLQEAGSSSGTTARAQGMAEVAIPMIPDLCSSVTSTTVQAHS